MSRPTGKKGLLPQHAPGSPRRLAVSWLHDILGDVDSAVSYPIDVSKGIAAPLGMFGNDQYGDCGPAAVAHERMLAGAHPTDQEVINGYLAYTKGQDVGVNFADYLLYLYRQGAIEGFAPVALNTVDAVMQRLARGVLLGVCLTDNDEQNFSDGKPWSLAGGAHPNPELGHAILKTRMQTSTGPGTIETWSDYQVIDFDWSQACVQEAWAIVTKDDMTDAAYAQLEAELLALPKAQGNTPPAPSPAPGPAPAPGPLDPPGPVPVPDLPPEFIAEVDRIVANVKRDLTHAFQRLDEAAKQLLGR